MNHLNRQHRIHNWTRQSQPMSIDSTISGSLKTSFLSSILLPLASLVKLRNLFDVFTDELTEHFRRSPIEEVRRRLARDRPTYKVLPWFLYVYYLFLVGRFLVLLKSSALANLDITFEILYLQNLAHYPLILFYIIFLLLGSCHVTSIFFNHTDHRLLSPFNEVLLANYNRFLTFHQLHRPLDPLQEPAYLNAIRLTRQNLVSYRDRSKERLFPYLSSKLYSKILSIGLIYELSYDRYCSYSQLLFFAATIYRLFTWPTARHSYLLFAPLYFDILAIGVCLAHSVKLLKLTFCLGRIVSLAFYYQLAKLAYHLRRKPRLVHLHAVLQHRIFSGKVLTVRRLQVEMLAHLLRWDTVFSILYSYWLVAVLPLAGGLFFVALKTKSSSEMPSFNRIVNFLEPGFKAVKPVEVNFTVPRETDHSGTNDFSSSSLDSVKLSLSVLALVWLISKSLYTVQQVNRLNDRLAAFYPLLCAFQARQGTYYANVLSLLKAMIYIELLGGRGRCKKLYALTVAVAGGQVANLTTVFGVWAALLGLLMMASKLCGSGE